MRQNRVLLEVPFKKAFEVIPITSGNSTEKEEGKLPVKLRLVLKAKLRPDASEPLSLRNQRGQASQLPLIDDKAYFSTNNQWMSKSSKSILKKEKTLSRNYHSTLFNKKDINAKNVHFGSGEKPLTQIIPIEPIKHPSTEQANDNNEENKGEDTKCKCFIV